MHLYRVNILLFNKKVATMLKLKSYYTYKFGYKTLKVLSFIVRIYIYICFIR